MSLCRGWVEPKCCTISPQNLTKPRPSRSSYLSKWQGFFDSTKCGEWHGSVDMPKLSIDPSDPGDESSWIRWCEESPCLRIDLMDLQVSILPDPKRAFGPREPRIAATAGPAEERCTTRSALFRATFSESVHRIGLPKS